LISGVKSYNTLSFLGGVYPGLWEAIILSRYVRAMDLGFSFPFQN
jgi:hypothetical protein